MISQYTVRLARNGMGGLYDYKHATMHGRLVYGSGHVVYAHRGAYRSKWR